MNQGMMDILGELCGKPEEPERDFYVEAQMILKGLTGIQPELRHLEALAEHYECSLIRIARNLGELKKTILEMP